MGFVYYGVYLSYYEVARVEALRSLGLPYRDLERDGFWMPVLENHSKYLLPLHYDEQITIQTHIPELPGARIRFCYVFFNEAGQEAHRGESILCFLRKDTGRPCKPPPHLITALDPFF